MDLGLLKDGTLVSTSKDKTVRFWDTETHLSKDVLQMKSKNLFATTTLPNGNLVVAEDTVIKIYNPYNL